MECIDCKSRSNTFFSGCRHLKLCPDCGGKRGGRPCETCQAPITTLIKEYDVRMCDHGNSTFVGTYPHVAPQFQPKGPSFWKMSKQNEKQKLSPWVLESETARFEGRYDGGEQTKYYVLMSYSGNSILAKPAGPFFKFEKQVEQRRRHLTLEEAENQLSKPHKTPRLNRTVKRPDEGQVDEEELKEEPVPVDDKDIKETKVKQDEFEVIDNDMPQPEAEKGDDWEHEEAFTDDEEGDGDLAPQPEPEPEPEPEVEEDDDMEANEQLLSESGRDMKKLLSAAKMSEANSKPASAASQEQASHKRKAVNEILGAHNGKRIKNEKSAQMKRVNVNL